MSKFISEQYLKEFITPAGIMSTAMIANMVPTLFKSVGNIIKTAKQQSRWDTYGCDAIVDIDEKTRCEVRRIDTYAAELSKNLQYCQYTNDQASCRQKIMGEIAKLRQQRTEKLIARNTAMAGAQRNE